MLLVLLSLAMATIATTAYLASRDNSILIGRNVAASATARSAADAGLELAIAILETETDWRSAHTAGVLVDDLVLGPALVDIEILDLATAEPPTRHSTHVEVRVRAVVDDVEQTVTGRAVVPPAGPRPGAVGDLDLSEFALFATEGILLRDEAIATRWTTAPLSVHGPRIAFGIQSIEAHSVRIQSRAAAIDTTLYHPPGASQSLVENASGPAVALTELPSPLPAPASPPPNTVDIGGGETEELRTTEAVTIEIDTRYAAVEVTTPGGLVVIEGDVTVLCEGDLALRAGARMLVAGRAALVVLGDMELGADTAIELAPEATLTLHVGGVLELDDAYIGDVRQDHSTRDTAGTAAYCDPQRVQIFSMPGATQSAGDDDGTGTDDGSDQDQVGGGNGNGNGNGNGGNGNGESRWIIEGSSVIKAEVYAPDPPGLEVGDASAVYGSIVAREIEVRDAAAVFYDPALDVAAGYTNPWSAVYDDEGQVHERLLLLVAFSDGALSEIAENLGCLILSFGVEYRPRDWTEPEPGCDRPDDDVATPRPIVVDYDLMIFGADIDTWEQNARDAANADDIDTPGG